MLIGCCLVVPAAAQTAGPESFQQVMPGIWTYGPCWAPSYSSTYQEGVLRGWGELWRGYGESVRSQAQGAVSAEQARELSIENRKREVTQYFDLRALNRERRFGHRGVSPRSAGSAAPVAHTQRTLRNVSSLGPTGRIDWPVVLLDDGSLAARKQVESAFARRAAGAEIRRGSAEYRQTRQAIDELLGDLKSKVSEVPASEYITAKTLLKDLRAEMTRTQPVQLTQK
jgi:hypothetical protein